MTGFKRGRKSASQLRSAQKRKEKKEQKAAASRDSLTHSYGLALYPFSPFSMDETLKIDKFRLQPVNPLLDTHNVADAFVDQLQDYGKFAPFRFHFHYELVTCEADWNEVVIDNDGNTFRSLDKNEKFRLITNVASAIILLMRVRGMTYFITPIELTGSTFQELSKKAQSVELRTRVTQCLIDFLPFPNPNPKVLRQDDIDWIVDHLGNVGELNTDGRMNFFHDLYDSLHFPNPSVQLTQIWTGIENIVQSTKKCTTSSIKSRCAMLLGKNAKEQLKISRSVGILYSFRSDIVHGSKSFSLLEYIDGFQYDGKDDYFLKGRAGLLFETYEILNQLITKVIEENKFPSKSKLNSLQRKFSKQKNKP